MAVSLNSVVGFSSTANRQHFLKNGSVASVLKASHLTLPLGELGIRQPLKSTRQRLCMLVANGDRLSTDTTDTNLSNAESSKADEFSAVNLPPSNTLEENTEVRPSAESGSEPQVARVSNGSITSTDLKGEEAATTNTKSTLKRSPLTAREKLRAARVLSRYTETKASKPKLGSKLLEALKESDKGKKRPGLPEAPANLFDDSKRGLPKQGWTFDFPGGVDVLLIVFSFVFISTVMFATTYIVWKVGAIHFNEY